MRKYTYFILLTFILFLSACSQEGKEKILEEKGYGDITKIEVTKLHFVSGQSIQNQQVSKVTVIEKTEELKKFMDVFNSRKESLAMYKLTAPHGSITIYKKDGSIESYNLWISEKSCLIADMQANQRKTMPYFTIENNPEITVIYNLVK